MNLTFDPKALSFLIRSPMDMKQAMYEQHMVRKYLDKPIPQECREKIEQHTRMLNDE